MNEQRGEVHVGKVVPELVRGPSHVARLGQPLAQVGENLHLDPQPLERARRRLQRARQRGRQHHPGHGIEPVVRASVSPAAPVVVAAAAAVVVVVVVHGTVGAGAERAAELRHLPHPQRAQGRVEEHGVHARLLVRGVESGLTVPDEVDDLPPAALLGDPAPVTVPRAMREVAAARHGARAGDDHDDAGGGRGEGSGGHAVGVRTGGVHCTGAEVPARVRCTRCASSFEVPNGKLETHTADQLRC